MACLQVPMPMGFGPSVGWMLVEAVADAACDVRQALLLRP
jgi:hypothetical protein